MVKAIDNRQFKRMVTRNVILPLGMSLVLCGIFVATVFYLVSLARITEQSDLIVAQTHRIGMLVVDSETGVRGYLLTGQENFLTPFIHSSEIIDQEIAELRERLTTRPFQQQRVDRLRELYKNWRDIFADPTIVKRRSHLDYMKPVSQGVGKNIVDQIRVVLDSLTHDEESYRTSKNRDARTAVTYAIWLTLFGTLIIGGFLAYNSRKELTTLSKMYGQVLDKQNLQNDALKERDWFSTASKQLSELIRGELTLDRAAKVSLDFLVRYLEAPIGALYVLNSGNVLQRHAQHALGPAQNDTKKEFKIGEGLVGECGETRALTVVSQLPSNYLQIESGTGDASPQSVLLFPFFADNQLKGVIELGFLETVSEPKKLLAESLAETIGIALKSAQYRERLQDLLEEAQRQAEELQVQQEELKVTNEELEEQAKMLRATQSQLEGNQTELEQTNNQLAEQATELERSADILRQQNDDLVETRTNLEEKAKELERTNQYKSQFLANVSHELRTPLNSTLILSQLLIENKDQKLQGEELEYIKTIHASSNDLLSLINDILDLAKIEAGKIEVSQDLFDLESLGQDLRRTFKPLAKDKKIALKIEVSTTAPQTLRSDRQKLEQILRNLLSNAIKFTHQGQVSLKIDSSDSHWISFAVTDTGIGIPLGQQEQIFDAFQQASNNPNRGRGSTGLGLAISRDLAKVLGGDIRLSSQPNKGSSFVLSIPTDQRPVSAHSSSAKSKTTFAIPKAKELSDASSLNPRMGSAKLNTFTPAVADDRASLATTQRVLLVVEDDLAFAKILYKLSHELDFLCVVASSAEEAMAVIDERTPNAVLLDINLPDHSGLMILDRLKQNPTTRHVPIHVISAREFSPGVLQMGAIGYLQKPAKKENIVGAMKKLRDVLTTDIKKVLIVEDNTVQRDEMIRVISDGNTETTAVGTAKEAFSALEKNAFDCMIVDLSLPDMNGFDMLEKLGTPNPKISKQPPVIIYTASDLSPQDEARLQRYSKSIIIKGVKSSERLMSEVSLFLHQVESKLPADRQNVLREIRDREKAFEGRKILVVDDDLRNIFALTSALESKGAKIEVARDGEEAVRKVDEIADLDLVLMDIMMPGMDGYEAISQIRARGERFARLPIIAVTARAMKDDQEKCLRAGANDYLSKPLDLPKLLSLMRVWMPQNARVIT